MFQNDENQIVINYKNEIIVWLCTIGIMLIIVGNFFIMRHIALCSISMVSLMVLGLGFKILNKDITFNYNYKFFLSFLGLLCVYLIGLHLHQETDLTIQYNLQFRTILIGYGFTFLVLPFFRKLSYRLFFWTYIITVICIMSVFCYNYYIEAIVNEGKNFYDPDWRYSMDRLIEYISPYGLWHHTLGIFIDFALLLSYFIYEENRYYFKFEKFALIISIVALIFFLHFISAKTGLVVFYSVIVYMLIRYYRSNKRIAVGSLVALGLVFIIAYMSVPTLKNRVDQFYSLVIETGSEKSSRVPGRVFSYQVGLEIIKDNFWKGISFGDASNYFEAYYKKNHPELKKWSWIRPHNQFLYYMCIMGVPLTILLICFLYYPLFVSFDRISNPIVIFYYGCTFYLMVDTPLDIREFFYFFSFWLPFLIYYQQFKKQIIST